MWKPVVSAGLGPELGGLRDKLSRSVTGSSEMGSLRGVPLLSPVPTWEQRRLAPLTPLSAPLCLLSPGAGCAPSLPPLLTLQH